jgi:hypothetical protein
VPADTTAAGGRSSTGSGTRAYRKKEGRRASTTPLPPASKAPQRLALPPGSLVCTGRRKGDRRGAVRLWREAMALRAVRPEAVEQPPVPGLTRPDAQGRDWPVIDGAPALNALARRPGDVETANLVPGEARRACDAPGASARPEKAEGAGRTAAPFHGCQDGSSLSLRIRTRLVRDLGRLGLGRI